MTNLYQKLLSWVDEGRSVVLLTLIDAKPEGGFSCGTKFVLSEDGKQLDGPGIPSPFLDSVQQIARSILTTGTARTETIEISGQAWEIYGEPVQAEPRLVLFGGGHVSSAVAKVAAIAGFGLTVVEDRADFAKPKRFPAGTEFCVGPWEEVVPKMDFHPNTYLAIMTRAHAYDFQILRWVIEKNWKYLAMIGSTKKVRKAFDRLETDGVSLELISRVHAPMGLDLGAQTPEEIAISVVAEMIAVKYGRSSVQRKPIAVS